MTNRTESGWHLDNSYARLPTTFFTTINPNPVESPELIIINDSLATSLGLDVQELQSDEGIAMLAGSEVPEGAMPLAQAYAGRVALQLADAFSLSAMRANRAVWPKAFFNPSVSGFLILQVFL